MIARKTPSSSRLIRSVKGEQRDSLIDVERAIEASSDTTTLDALSRRGVSDIRVLDRRKVGMLIRQAVTDALDEHASRHLKSERKRIEQDSLKRVEDLLRRQAPGASWADTAYGGGAPGGGLSQLAELLNALSRVRSGEGFPAAPPQQERFSEIESRMEKLMSKLERAESAAARTSDSPSRTYRWKGHALDKRQQSMLKNIFEDNLDLQALQK